MSESSRLVLAATPIGNPADASERLRHLLATADVIAAEDTRKTRALAAALGIQTRGRFVSYYDAVELDRVPELLAAVEAGQTVLVVSDAGMPGVSDPGYRIAAAAMAAGLKITVAPGPSAAVTALALSGLPSDRWAFEGFLPRKSGERQRALQELAADSRTLVFFEAPHRIAATVSDLVSAFGPDRPAALCRELTKTYEEVVRGTLADLAARCESEVLGEITLVVAGRRQPEAVEDEELLTAATALLASGMERKAVIAELMDRYGVPKRRVFDLLVAAKSGVKPAEGELKPRP